MKKSLSLAIFLLSSSSLLHAKGGLEKILGGPEQDLHLRITYAIKKQKARVSGQFKGPVHRGLKGQYEEQVKALGKIIKKHSSMTASSSEHSNVESNLVLYNSAKNSIKQWKKSLPPYANLRLKIGFASLPITGAQEESVRYQIALIDDPLSALEHFQTEFHKHDYHQFIEWRNYASYLTNAATTLETEGHAEISTEYKKAAFRIYEEILPDKEIVFKILRSETLPARLYNARAGTSGELGGELSTDELLEMTYYEAGTLALSLGQTGSALTFLLRSSKLAKKIKRDRPDLPYLLAYAWYNWGEKEGRSRNFRYAADSYDEYFESNPKTINLDYYIKAAAAAIAALTPDETDREDEMEMLRKTYLMRADLWMRKVIDTLKITNESDRLNFKRIFKNNALTLAGIAYKDGDCPAALYFYEGILQNESILNQPSLNSSMQYYNAGTMAYLAQDHAKARLYLSMVNREDPLIVADEKIGESISTWLKEIALLEASPSSSVAGPSTSYES